MLDPDQRTLYSSVLRPPAGYVVDEAIATTYSLDLTTLLTIPMYLVLFSGREDQNALLRDPIALLEALKRMTARIGVYCQQGSILVPTAAHSLYALLEPMVREVRAPYGGVFHPKLWLLRFTSPESAQPPLLRLVVLSRNVTADRSWDLSLVLEGTCGRARRTENAGLRDLLLELKGNDPGGSPNLLRFAEEVHCAKWELPPGFEQVHFHLLGLGKKRWHPPQSARLAVISPFCSDHALRELAATTSQPLALISRPDELAKIPLSTLRAFERVLVLAEQAEIRDEEDASLPSEPSRLQGLHAKAYVLKKGWDTHVIVGSANATNAALVHGINIEILVELVGKTSRVGKVETLLGSNGFGAVLEEYVPPTEPVLPDPLEEAAERALQAARESLADASLRLVCVGSEDTWRLSMQPSRPVALPGITAIRTWLVSRQDAASVSAEPLVGGDTVEFPPVALATISGFVAFELQAVGAPVSLRFVLNLPIDGLPEGRDAAIVRGVIRDRAAFLRYLLLLLGYFGDGSTGETSMDGLLGFGAWQGQGNGEDDLPLLEDMTRALCRDPSRLRAIQRLVTDLDARANADVVPEPFMELWDVFETVLKENGA